MSKDKELTAEDYRDAANRYGHASPKSMKGWWEQAVQESAAEFKAFWDGAAGQAARVMLEASGRVIHFGVSKDSFGDAFLEFRFEFDGKSIRSVCVGTGEVSCDPLPSLIRIVKVWCAINRGSAPKDFMPWFLGELKKIHDEAPKDPQGDGSSEDDASDGTAGCERKG